MYLLKVTTKGEEEEELVLLCHVNERSCSKCLKVRRGGCTFQKKQTSKNGHKLEK